MSSRQLSILLVGLVAAIAVAFLVLLFRLPPGVPVVVRLTDYEAEQRAGTLPAADAAKPESGSVDLRGELVTFDGVPAAGEGGWPRFRGADYRNVATDGVPLADQWPAGGPPVLWEAALGEGYAGPAVWRGRVYVLDYDEERAGDALRCLSLADGREIWRRWYHSPIKRNHGFSRTVPAVTDEYVVTVGPACHVVCAGSTTGEFRWGIDLVAEYGTEVPLWYTGQCPLIDDGVAVIAPGGRALLLGVDCATGEVVWQTPNPNGWKMSHSSVMPMTLLGRRMYVYCAIGGITGVSAEPADRGTVLWQTSTWTHSVMSPSPVAVDDRRVFLTAGYGGGSMMLELRETAEGLVAEPRFKLEKSTFACEQQTPLLLEEHLFGVLPKDAGELRAQFVCLDLDGGLVWTSGPQERFGLGPFLATEDKIFILNDNGELTLIRRSVAGFELLARARVLTGREAWGPMALVEGRLLVRDFETLRCLDVRSPGALTVITER